MKNTLVVMMGVAGSGKSTIAKIFESTHNDCRIISRDRIRFGLLEENPNANYFDYENIVKNKYFNLIHDSLKNHTYVVADATHLTPKSRKELFHKAQIDESVKVVGIWVETDLETALKQNSQRSNLERVPEEAIKKMFKSKISPRNFEQFNEVIYVNPQRDIAIGKASPLIEPVLKKISDI